MINKAMQLLCIAGAVMLPSCSAVREIVAGRGNTCAVLNDGSLKCWGYNFYGQLGLGDKDYRGDGPNEMGNNLTAVDLGTNRTAVRVSAGSVHICAVLDNGSVKCWGNNIVGQLGLEDTNDRGDNPNEMGDNLPAVNLGTGRTAIDVASANEFTCALLDDKSVKCWGYNAHGELGLGDKTTRGGHANQMGDNLPTLDLGTGRTAVAICSGVWHTCAILDDGSVKCWGYNDLGQLGQGDRNNRGDDANEMGDNLPPVDLGTDRKAVAIDCTTGYHTCVVLDDKSSKCWGYNNHGQLGIGDTTWRGAAANQMGDSLATVVVGTNTVASSLATGESHTCAVLSDGSVKCWGENYYGQLGLGDISDRGDQSNEMGNNLTAVDLGTGLTAIAVSAGDSHTCAILDDAFGSVKCWGYNHMGQLGLGDKDSRGDGPDAMGDNLPFVALGEVYISPDDGDDDGSTDIDIVMIAVVVVGVVLILCCMSFCCYQRKQQKQEKSAHTSKAAGVEMA